MGNDRSFATATALTARGDGRYAVTLAPAYTVMGHPNGGYLQAVAAAGARAEVDAAAGGAWSVLSLTTNYLASPEVGPAEVVVRPRRVGRSAAFVHVELVQEGRLVNESVAALGPLAPEPTLHYHDPDAPVLADRDACRRTTGGGDLNIMRVVDQRLDPSTTRWFDGERSTRALVEGWLRLDDGAAEWTPASLFFAGDVFPPATMPLGHFGWAPTLQLTTHVVRPPRTAWLRARQYATAIADGLMEERCELFDESGYLVATSTQLAMVRIRTAGEA